MTEKERLYTIERVSNAIYMDDARQVVDGYRVQVRVHAYDEVRTLQVPTDDPIEIEAAILSMIERRDTLALLGV